jgi:gamma-glutamyl-gamma-aminobutyrate hydrolase PuuD
MLKLGLSQRVAIDPGTGERRDCLDQEWTRLLEGQGYCVVPIPNTLADIVAHVEAQALDGILLTGGNDLAHVENANNPAPERDASETQLIDWAVATKTPLLGVCRGMQMLAQHFGSRLTRVEGHVAKDHELERAAGALLPLEARETTNSYHNFGIAPADLGEVLCIEAVDSEGKVEALRHRSEKLYGIMWHPERGGATSRDERILDTVFRGDTKPKDRRG